MSFEISLILGAMLVGATIVALMVRKLVWSLIMLFYSSIIFGVLLISYGATFAGLIPHHNLRRRSLRALHGHTNDRRRPSLQLHG